MKYVRRNSKYLWIKCFEPDAASHRVYNDLYRQVYLATYEKLEPLYRKIASITGYPSGD